MKVLFDHSHPFFLAHGGFQTQIEQTKVGLESLGVEVEWVRWWDDRQSGDIIHFFGRPAPGYVGYAQAKGFKVVIAELLTGLGSRGNLARMVQTAIIRMLRRNYFFERMGWQSYQLADAAVALTPWEARLMVDVFDAPPHRVHVIPNGVEDTFFQETPKAERGRWLVCTATIAPRKRVLELAAAAVLANVPVWVLGRPYSDEDPYASEFRDLANKHPTTIRYAGPVDNREELAKIYREARGFVLLSTMETLSISALEAAACGCPLLLTDLPWARTSFGESARYCPIADPAVTAPILRKFYDEAKGYPAPPRPANWRTVAEQFRQLYLRLLKTSR